MRIAFVSYEYPPDTGIGGIGTYVLQVASLFAQRNIQVAVVCGSPHSSGTEKLNDCLTVHRILCNSREEFITLSPALLQQLHRQQPIDLIEVPEFGAEGRYIKPALPGIPLIVKLHTPSFLIRQLNNHYYNKTILRRLALVFKKKYHYTTDAEYAAIQKADYILSPSLSLTDIVSASWKIPKEKIIHAPNPYIANPAFLSMPPSVNNNKVLYIGRLETRKGVQELAKAIPLIIEQKPDVVFTFLGKDSKGPLREKSMKRIITKTVGKKYSNSLQFIDHVSLSEIPAFMQQASVCVFPSIWENFPNVCLEAMSAARGIVASNNGGMKDMLQDVNGGILVDPFNTAQLATAVVQLLNHAEERNKMAERSRNKIKEYYTARLVDELVNIYRSFIH